MALLFTCVKWARTEFTCVQCTSDVSSLVWPRSLPLPLASFWVLGDHIPSLSEIWSEGLSWHCAATALTETVNALLSCFHVQIATPAHVSSPGQGAAADTFTGHRTLTSETGQQIIILCCLLWLRHRNHNPQTHSQTNLSLPFLFSIAHNVSLNDYWLLIIATDEV